MNRHSINIPKGISPINRNSEVEMHQDALKRYQDNKRFYETRLIEEEKVDAYLERERKIENIKDIIKEYEGKIQEEKDWLAKNGSQVVKEQGNNYSDLKKQNQELRQQLSEVQKQLAKVLEELKKLKINANGKVNKKLEQQIVQNERLIKDSENVSVVEVQEQVNKSEALMKEFNTSASINKDNKGNGSLPYVIGGSVILAVAGIIAYLVVRKSKRK